MLNSSRDQNEGTYTVAGKGEGRPRCDFKGGSELRQRESWRSEAKVVENRSGGGGGVHLQNVWMKLLLRKEIPSCRLVNPGLKRTNEKAESTVHAWYSSYVLAGRFLQKLF